MFKTDAQMDTWGAGLQAAQQSGAAGVGDYLRTDLPGMWIKDTAAAAVTAGASSYANAGLKTSISVSSEHATSFLMNSGMSASRAADYVSSFEGGITARMAQPGENFLRYTDVANSKGSFLTNTQFANPAGAVKGLYLGPYGNGASLVQPVTASGRSIVLEGGVANGTQGVQQSLTASPGSFLFGLGVRF